jgi:hypothetical protein
VPKKSKKDEDRKEEGSNTRVVMFNETVAVKWQQSGGNNSGQHSASNQVVALNFFLLQL